MRGPDPGEPGTASAAVSGEVERLHRLYGTLGQVHRAIIRLQHREELFREVCRLIGELAGFRFVWIGWLDPETRLVRPVGRHGHGGEHLDGVQVRADDSPEGRGAVGTAIREGRACIVNDLLSDPRGQPWSSVATLHGVRAVAALPIRAGGAVSGALAVYSEEPGVFRAEETSLLEGIAASVSYVLDALERASRQQEAEVALRDQRRTLRHAQAMAHVVAWTYDVETGLLDTPAQSGPGGAPDVRTMGQILGSVAGEDVHRVRTAWLDAHAGAPYDVEYRMVLGGRTHWMHSQAAFEFDAGGHPVRATGITQDITERKRAQARLSLQHAVSRVLAESGSLGEATPRILGTLCEAEGWAFAALWELAPRTPYLRATQIWQSPKLQLEGVVAVTRSLRFGPGEGLPGRVWSRGKPVFIPDLASEPDFRRRDVAVACGLRTGFGFPVRLRGGITGVIDFLGEERSEPDPALVETLEAVGRQIGQFIERQRALDELQRFVSVSPTVLYVMKFEPPSLDFTWLSDNVGQVTGYPPDRVFDREWWIGALHPEDRARVLALLPNPGQSDLPGIEYRFRRADGTYRWFRDERRILRDDAGHAAEVIGTWFDITRRVELEGQLRQAQKMESLGQLSGGIAHDFNNLLAIILGHVQILRLDLPADHPAQASVDEISQAGERARNLVQQILAFSRRQAPERRTVHLAPVIEEAARLLRATLPAGVELITRIAPDLPAASVDANQIHQILLNLGTNAWHALEGRPGRITLSLEAVSLDPASVERHPGLRPGRHLVLAVSDTGKGMDHGIRERIFDPFFTTKAPGTGTGLGLSVVHGIVQAHEGAIEVFSEPGAGATFRIYLPAGRVDGPTPEPPLRRALFRGGGESILLLDDEGPVLASVRSVLERLGYQVTGFLHPSDAIAAVRDHPGRFDLAITDFNMPGVSGLDVAAQWLRIRPDLPVLLNSGYVSAGLLAEAHALGVRHVLQKPHSLEELSEAIRSSLPAPPAAPSA